MPNSGETAELLAAIEAQQQRLQEILAGHDEAAMAWKPPTGKWSVIENLRHLLFAEQARLGQFIPGGPAWSPLVLPPRGMQRHARFSSINFDVNPAPADVFRDWQEAHAAARPFITGDSGEVCHALDKSLRHLRNHIAVIERLLRQQARHSPPPS